MQTKTSFVINHYTVYTLLVNDYFLGGLNHWVSALKFAEILGIDHVATALDVKTKLKQVLDHGYVHGYLNQKV